MCRNAPILVQKLTSKSSTKGSLQIINEANEEQSEPETPKKKKRKGIVGVVAYPNCLLLKLLTLSDFQIAKFILELEKFLKLQSYWLDRSNISLSSVGYTNTREI